MYDELLSVLKCKADQYDREYLLHPIKGVQRRNVYRESYDAIYVLTVGQYRPPLTQKDSNV